MTDRLMPHRLILGTGRAGEWLRRIVVAIALMIAAAASNAYACTVSPPVTTNLGSYSSPAMQRSAVPAVRSRGGLSCASSLVTLLGGSYIRGRFSSANGFRLLRADGPGTITYTASADPAGTVPFAQGTTVNYMQNNLLNVLGLLGGSSADLPFFVKPSAAASLPLGTYTDRVTITWSWYLCPGGIGLGGLCIGGAESGTGSAVIDVTLIVTRRDVTIALTNVATWDPDNGTRQPKTLPGGRGRLLVTISNPDLIPLDEGTFSILLPRPAGTTVALDGDGTADPAVVRMSEGATPSTVAIRYAGPGDMTDDVDFSADAGGSWTFVPVAGDPASQSQVTHVRVRPRGTMAKQSSFAVSVPYLVR